MAWKKGSFSVKRVLALDCTGNPFLSNGYFLLAQKSDRRKLLLWLAKKDIDKKDCREKQEIASKNRIVQYTRVLPSKNAIFAQI